MDEKYYTELPKKIALRAEEYLKHAKELATKSFGAATANDIPLISVQLAAAMMTLEAAEISAFEIERIADKAEGS